MMLLKEAKKHIGKYVLLIYKDPAEGGHTNVPQGRAALATWCELGYVKEIKKGVLALFQGVCWDQNNAGITEYKVTHVPLSLVETITTDLKQFEEEL